MFFTAGFLRRKPSIQFLPSGILSPWACNILCANSMTSGWVGGNPNAPWATAHPANKPSWMRESLCWDSKASSRDWWPRNRLFSVDVGTPQARDALRILEPEATSDNAFWRSLSVYFGMDNLIIQSA